MLYEIRIDVLIGDKESNFGVVDYDLEIIRVKVLKKLKLKN